MIEKRAVSRREFMGSAMATTLAVGTAALAGRAALAGEGKVIKAGLIGCGGRGNGAIRDCLNAGKAIGVEVRVAALADAFQDRLDGTRNGLAKEGVEVPADRCFVGFDAYKKLIATDVDVVLNATSPNFRPTHVEAAVQAGKHIFMEKPIAVDPVGCRKIMEVGKMAQEKGLAVVAGTQRRHSSGYIATQEVVSKGAIGRIVGGEIYWCMGALWFRERKPEWSDAEYLVRNWVSFAEMSGDHICEQHVHNIDVANWFIGAHPLAAVGFGSRARRKTGNQFDFFSIDYEYPDGLHIHSMCRQVTGCWNSVCERLVGEKGTTSCSGGVKTAGKVELPKVETHKSPMIQEHIDLLRGILKEKPINEAQNVAEATMAAIMGRISAYTGQRVTWDEMMASDFVLSPTPADFEAGKVVLPKEEPPVPGKA